MSLRKKVAHGSLQIILIFLILLGLPALQNTKDKVVFATATKSIKFRSQEQQAVAKASQLFEVKFETPSGFPVSNSATTTIRVHIKLQRALDNGFHYQWALPAGSQWLGGAGAESIQQLAPGEELIREIRLKGFSSEGLARNLKLNLQANDHGVPVGNTAIFRSHPTRSDLTIGYRDQTSGRSLDPAIFRSQQKPNTPTDPQLPRGVRL